MHSFSPLIGLLCFTLLVSAKHNSTRAHTTQILNPEVDEYINSVLADFNSPGGAAVAVVRMDATGAWQIETKGYGFAKADGTKVGPGTIFPMGSNSKVSYFASALSTTLILCSSSTSLLPGS